MNRIQFTKAPEGTFPILDQRFEEFVSRMVKLSLKAAKTGSVPPTFKQVGVGIEQRYNEGGKPVVLKVRYVQIVGEAPKFEGWSFVARIDKLGDGYIVNTVPTFEGLVPEQYRHHDGTCEHCRTKRNRKDLFLVRHDNGTWVCVGRSCLKDFLGHNDPGHIANMMGYLRSLGSAEGDCDKWSPKIKPEYVVEEVLEATAAVLRSYGWVGSTGDGMRTSHRALWLINNGPGAFASKYDKAEWEEMKEKIGEWPTGEDEATVKETISFVNNDMDDSDYSRNLKQFFEAETFEGRGLGIVVSAVRSYHRHLGFLSEKQARAAEHKGYIATSSFIGEIGERVNFTGTIERTWTGEGHYGDFHIVTFRTPDGNAVVYKGGNWYGEEGNEVNLRATVKELATFRDEKQTIITRPKEM